MKSPPKVHEEFEKLKSSYVTAQWIEKSEQKVIPMLDMSMEYISIKEYAERFGISMTKVFCYCAGGGLGAIKLGRIWHIPVKREEKT
jgi:hypothetical protein